MTRWWINVRSAVRWGLVLVFFAVGVSLLLTCGLIFSQHRLDWMLRGLFSGIQRLVGARVRYHYAAGFDRTATTLYLSNHVNVFDPFFLYPGIPQFSRGVELESHFKIPFYGWLMGKWGNIPVPDEETVAALKRMFRRTQEALDAGTSLVIFPEGHRTLTGRVGPLQDGAFTLAQRFGCRLTPISIVGSFAFQRKGDWRLHPRTIDVYLHDSIDMGTVGRKELPALRERVHAIIAGPVNADLDSASSA